MNKLLTFTRRNTPTLFFAKIIALFFFAVAFTQLSFGQQGCPNLVTNGDFTLGVNSFTTSFSPGCITGTDCNKGFYCVNPDFKNKCSSWASGSSLAPSGGNFMIIDGFLNGTAPFDVWRYTPSIPVVAGKSYIFSFWAKSVHPTTGGQAFDLDMAIRPLEPSGIKNPPTIFTIPITNVWTKYSRTWLCPPNATGASLFIQQPIGKDFSDFGLDDISFTCACQAAFTATPINNCGLYQITNTSVGTPPISYQWCNGVTTPSLGNVQLNCGKNDYCLTMTAADGCTSTVTQSINFTETTPPVITCPINKTINCNESDLPANTGTATATDNCTLTPDISITYTEVVSGIANCDQTIRRTWTAKDKCGNTSSCIQTISIIDNVKPALFNCPPNTTVNGTIGANGLCSAVVPLLKPSATDNCAPSVTITHNIPTGNIFPNGNTTVIWTATDDCMNTATCSTIVTVVCNDCKCGTFSGMTFRPAKGAMNFPVKCGDTLAIGCRPTFDPIVGGLFQCMGNTCPDSALVNWTLNKPGTTNLGNGNIYAKPSFSLSLLGSYFTVSGIYELTLTGVCNGVKCPPCKFYFKVPPVNLTSNLTGYFPFYGNANDASPTLIHGIGTNILPALAINNTNSAFNFNGTSSEINCQNNNRGVIDAVSVCAWVKTNEKNRGMWVAGQYESVGQPKGYLLAIGNVNNASIGLASFSGRVDATNYYSATAPPSITVNDGKWHCLVGTAGNGEWKIYVDGVLRGTTIGLTTPSIAIANSPKFSIGVASSGANPMWYQGDMDDVRVYNRVLDECEIASLCATSFASSAKNIEDKILSLHIFPNPNLGSFTVELPIVATPKMTLRITDLTGRLILEKPTDIGTQLQNVDTTTLPNGLYFLQVVADGKTIAVEKFVKQ